MGLNRGFAKGGVWKSPSQYHHEVDGSRTLHTAVARRRAHRADVAPEVITRAAVSRGLDAEATLGRSFEDGRVCGFCRAEAAG